MKKENSILYGLLITILLIYCCGLFFPDYFWATHFIAFTPLIFKIVILFLIISLFLKIYFSKNEDLSREVKFVLNNKTISVLAIAFMALAMLFPMVKDFYGDAYKFNSFLTIIPSTIPDGTNEKFFTFSLSPWAGEGTILAMVTYIAYFIQVTYKTAFVIFDAVFGGLFIITWLHFIKNFIKTATWRFILGVLGFTAPFILVFFGHIEIYAPIFFFILLWIYLALLFIKNEKNKIFWLLFLVTIISIKLHSISLLLTPALMVIIWKKYKGNYPNWKQIGIYMISPIFIIGGLLYFFVFKDHIDDRSLQTTAMAFDHIFLPLFSPPAPLDNYNLFSFNHIFDFFSVLFLWSPLALFLVLYITIIKYKEINWNAPDILITGLCLFLFSAFLFMVNPLLSLPIDWDLFSLPAPFLLVFLGVLVSHVELRFSTKKIGYASWILVIISFPIFIVHQSETMLSKRLESLGVRIFSTYYEWTAKTIESAYSLDDEYKMNRYDRGDKLLNKLKPKAKKEIDYEYSSLLIDQGRYYLRIRGNSEKAIELFNEAQTYDTAYNAKILSLEAYFNLKQYHNAFEVSKELVNLQYPDPKKALKIYIHCGLEYNKYKDVFEACKAYVRNWPEDETVSEVYKRLSENDRIGELKFLFQNSNR